MGRSGSSHRPHPRKFPLSRITERKVNEQRVLKIENAMYNVRGLYSKYYLTQQTGDLLASLKSRDWEL